jgi:hypothetical protein
MKIEELGIEISDDVVVEVDYNLILSTGYWYKANVDEFGNALTYKTSNGYWSETKRDKFGKQLTYKTSDGYWSEITRDEFGNELNYECGKLNKDE